MTTIFHNFDNAKTAFINPNDIMDEDSSFPDVCVTTFSENIIQKIAEIDGVKRIAYLYSANGTLPVYEIEYAGKRIAFFLSRVGAPACVAGLEEIIALGAKKIVIFGCCGVLNQSAVQDKIVIPSSAIRDEGTSYHYIPANDEIYADKHSINILKQCLDKCSLSYAIGKTWTTDAIYRETHKILEERKRQGCLVVEMECSAVYAIAQFRNIPVIQFLYGADNLDSERWEPRDLTDYGATNCSKYVELAFECAACL